MNTKIKSLVTLCIAIICCACENLYDEFSTSTQEGVELTITATREGIRPDSRTIRLEDGSVRWVPGDEISVFYNSGTDGGSKFTCQNSDTTDIAEFKGTLAGISAGGENYTDGNYLYAIYPYSANNSLNDEVATITLPTYQTAEEGSFQNGLFPTMARAQSHNLAFYNICGGVKFTVSRDDIISVCFKGNDGERLTGSAKVTFDENEYPKVLDDVVESVDSIIIFAPDGGAFKAGKEYYMIAYPTQLASGYTMTFRTSAMKEGKVVSSDAVQIERSIFGVLNDVDTRVTEWTDATSGGGGTNSGIYLGVVGFNQYLYSYPIVELTETSKSGLDSFIDGLTMKDGTVLYYSVDQALDRLQSVHLPSDLATAAIVTFTDGLDEGSTWKPGVTYEEDMDYLDAMNKRIKNETVSGLPITAYSIGLKGKAVTNEAKFKRNLEKLASSEENWTEVTSMDEVSTKFKEIARQLSSSSYYQTINLRMPGKSTGTKIRFTFDNVKRAEDSKLYIEGTLNKETVSLENVEYVGMESTSGTTIKGTRDDIFVTLTFEGVHTANNKLLVKNFIEEYHMDQTDTSWQPNPEFSKEENSSLATNYNSAVVMLVLDCSSSLEGIFSQAKNSAKHFINILSESTDEEHGNGEYQGDEWIDPEFAKVLQQNGYIKDAATVRPSEVENLTYINVSGTSTNNGSLTSLRGIEYFSSLRTLYCSYNNLTSLDLFWNRKLTTLYCNNNQLTQLDISKNTQLTTLSCYSNKLTQLDISKNTQLTGLSCYSNKLTQLDLSKNTQLTYLECESNKLTQLDISKNTQLTNLYCGSNQLTQLDISKNTQLTELYCNSNKLTQLDLSKNTQLTYLECESNQLTQLDLSKNTQLTYLICSSNKLTQLDLSKNTQLTYLECKSNQLTQLDLSKNTELTVLNCHYNSSISSLDVSKNTKLQTLYCYGCQLTSLDVRKNTQLWNLSFGNCSITSIDISNNTKLNFLYCCECQLTGLDISKNTSLTTLRCASNPGSNRQFRVKAWFDNNSVPSEITSDDYYQSSWTYNGSTVSIYYYK